jgi:predicted acylesterase/phospholipase RssA
LAAGTHSHDILKQLYKRHGKLDPLSLNVIFDLAGGEIVARIVGVLRMLSTLDPGEVVVRLQRLVPVGFFRGEKLKSFIERQLARLGIPDNVSALKKELYISATEQDTGEHVVFGEEPWREIKISQAIRASTALPPFYLPERINGHWFADGQLTSSSDFNTAIRKGAGLILMIDPMVAYTSNSPGAVMRHGGYFTTVQAIKSLVQTRFSSMLKHSMDVNPDVDFVVFRPTDEVMEAMAGNPMRYRIRTELAEMGYRGTVQQILAQYDSLFHKFAKHGLVLKSRNDIERLLSKTF